MNLDLEVQNLRYALENKGWEDTEIEEICDLAAADLNEIVLDVIESAVAEAIDSALNIGADDFVNDIDIIPMPDGMYRIWARSGKTDYSMAEAEMLPNLLKNAETSAAGDRYKVIPMKEKSGHKIGNSMFDMMQARQKAITDARAALREQVKNKRSQKANTMAEAYRSSLGQQMSVKRSHAVDDHTGPIKFRTASSKQDAKKDWVIPNRDADLTPYLNELNDRMATTIQQSATVIMDSYYREYALR